MSISVVAVFLVPLATRLMLLHAQAVKAKRKHGAVVFPATSLLLLCAVSLAFAIIVAVGGYRQGDGAITVPLGLIWAAFSLWLWPTTIVLDRHGVSARHIWRRKRFISYSEIAFVSRLANRQAVIYGSQDLEIAVSEYHVAADALESLLRGRASPTTVKALSFSELGVLATALLFLTLRLAT